MRKVIGIGMLLLPLAVGLAWMVHVSSVRAVLACFGGVVVLVLWFRIAIWLFVHDNKISTSSPKN